MLLRTDAEMHNLVYRHSRVREEIWQRYPTSTYKWPFSLPLIYFLWKNIPVIADLGYKIIILKC